MVVRGGEIYWSKGRLPDCDPFAVELRSILSVASTPPVWLTWTRRSGTTLAFDDERVQAHLIIRGYVQGVYFRARLKQQADAFGVSGWTRNLPDGSVEAELEGPHAAVDAVIGWAHVGPPTASVDSVEVAWGVPNAIAPHGAFEVR